MREAPGLAATRSRCDGHAAAPRRRRKAVRPGVMPTLFGHHMIGHCLFITLDEMSSELPDLYEYVGGPCPAPTAGMTEEEKDSWCAMENGHFDVACDMEPEQRDEYRRVVSYLEYANKELLQQGLDEAPGDVPLDRRSTTRTSRSDGATIPITSRRSSRPKRRADRQRRADDPHARLLGQAARPHGRELHRGRHPEGLPRGSGVPQGTEAHRHLPQAEEGGPADLGVRSDDGQAERPTATQEAPRSPRAQGRRLTGGRRGTDRARGMDRQTWPRVRRDDLPSPTRQHGAGPVLEAGRAGTTTRRSSSTRPATICSPCGKPPAGPGGLGSPSIAASTIFTTRRRCSTTR